MHSIRMLADLDRADLEGSYFLASKITLRSMLSRGMESQFPNFRRFLLPLKRAPPAMCRINMH